MIHGRLRRHHAEAEPAAEEDQLVEIDPAELTGVFNVPDWLRNIGLMSWLLVGVTLLICGLVWLGALTQVITIPLIIAGDARRRRLAAGQHDAAPPRPPGTRLDPADARESSPSAPESE